MAEALTRTLGGWTSCARASHSRRVPWTRLARIFAFLGCPASCVDILAGQMHHGIDAFEGWRGDAAGLRMPQDLRLARVGWSARDG